MQEQEQGLELELEQEQEQELEQEQGRGRGQMMHSMPHRKKIQVQPLPQALSMQRPLRRQ